MQKISTFYIKRYKNASHSSSLMKHMWAKKINKHALITVKHLADNYNNNIINTEKYKLRST